MSDIAQCPHGAGPIGCFSFVFTYQDDAGTQRACTHYRNVPGRPRCDGSGQPILAPTLTARNTEGQNSERPGREGIAATQLE